MIDLSLYRGREQTAVKHFILSEYLQRFAPIIGKWCSTITYVDCFSGPWQEQSEEYKDTSFAIALQELRKAREAQRVQFNRDLTLRAFFVERDRESYEKLKSYADQIRREDVEIETRNDALENSIGDIVAFVRAGKSKNFPFLFIDPTGWTGFGLEAIVPLLGLNPGEVLINFMTGHIRRLVEHPDDSQQAGFEALYGRSRCARVLSRVRGTTGLEREDILVSEYMDAIRDSGGYEHVSAAVVLNPGIDRTHFHLIYGTRHSRGLEVFKGAEKKAMEAMRQARADVQDRKDEQRTNQLALDFRREVPRADSYYQELRERYSTAAKNSLFADLRSNGRVGYDAAYSQVLSAPLTFDADLKEWIEDWRRRGLLRLEGLKERERVPKAGFGHVLVWTGGPEAGA